MPTLGPIGIVLAWGANSRGQLGNDTQNYSNVPRPVPGLHDIVAVAAGATHSLALRADSTVWAWGSDQLEQLGAPTRRRCRAWPTPLPCSAVPVQVPGLRDIVAIAAADTYSYALQRDGTVWGWGANGDGELGTRCPQFCYASGPVRVPHLAGVMRIATDGSSTLALRADGMVWEWGYLVSLGGPPQQVAGLDHVIALAPRQVRDSGLAVKSDGSVWQWTLAPPGYSTTKVSPLAGLSAIAAVWSGINAQQAWALGRDGTVWSWGFNWWCLLGLGRCVPGDGTSYANTSTDQRTPARISTLPPISALATGLGDHFGVVARNGMVWMWGDNTTGALGLGHSGGLYGTPQHLHLAHIAALAIGGDHTLALQVAPGA